MDMEDTGNTTISTGVGTSLDAEVAELQRDYAEAVEEFGLGVSVTMGDDPDFDELNAAIAGTDLDGFGESAGSSTLLDIADGWRPGGMTESEEEIFGKVWGFVTRRVKKKAAALIKKATRIVKKASKYKGCLPGLLKAVALFKAGQYGKAVVAAGSVIACIASK